VSQRRTDPAGPSSVLAGPLEATFDGGALRWIRWHGVEVVRSVHPTVRDRHWGTIEPDPVSFAIESDIERFIVSFESRHRAGEIDYRWTGRVTGDADGEVVYEIDGRVRRAFRSNRLGLCVLFPLSVIGRPVTVRGPSTVVRDTFPVAIAPDSPWTGITSMTWDAARGIEASLEFGEVVYEMEDHRNWTDASFKAYSPPLADGAAFTIPVAERRHRSVRLHLAGRPRSRVRRIGRAANVSLGRVVAPAPALGFGLPAGRFDAPLVDFARSLSPDHLRWRVDARRGIADGDVDSLAAILRDVDAGLELELITDQRSSGVAQVIDAIRRRRIPVARVLPFRANGLATPGDLVEDIAGALRRQGSRWPICFASRANFAELNRAGVPPPEADQVAFPIDPQVHAFDDASIVETLEAIPMAVRDARRIGSDRPVSVTPIGFFGARDLGRGSTLADSRNEARIRQPFGAAWALGVIEALVISGAAAGTFFDLSGPSGLALTDADGNTVVDGNRSPLQDLFRALRTRSGAALEIDHTPDVSAVAFLIDRSVTRLLVANRGDQATVVDLHLPDVPWRQPSVASDGWDTAAPVGIGRGATSVELSPFGLAVIDITPGRPSRLASGRR